MQIGSENKCWILPILSIRHVNNKSGSWAEARRASRHPDARGSTRRDRATSPQRCTNPDGHMRDELPELHFKRTIKYWDDKLVKIGKSANQEETERRRGTGALIANCYIDPRFEHSYSNLYSYCNRIEWNGKRRHTTQCRARFWCRRGRRRGDVE